MRIGIQTWGTTGDVRPMVALGAALTGRGHQVTLVASCIDGVDHAEVARSLGITYRALPIGISLTGRELSALARSDVGQLGILLDRYLLPGEAVMTVAARELVEHSDVVVGHLLAHPLRICAQRRSVPCASVTFWPGMVPSSLYPPFPFPPMGRALNQLGWRLARRVIDRLVLPRLAPAFQRAGLSVPRDACDGIWFSSRLNLIPASPVLCQADPDWGNHVMTGHWDIPISTGNPPLDAGLEEFLSRGDPPVLMTLGSLQQLDPLGALTLFTEAARQVGCRAIIAANGIQEPPGDDLIRYVSGMISHQRLLPRCALVVHHGGAGTTHAVARAGRASIVTSILAEQSAWGRILHRRGAGLAPVAYHGLRSASLARLIRRGLRDTALQRCARDIGARMSGESGLDLAVARIEALAAR